MPNYSTNSALIKITEQIQKACDKEHFASGVCIDLKRAFQAATQHTTKKTGKPHATNHKMLLTSKPTSD